MDANTTSCKVTTRKVLFCTILGLICVYIGTFLTKKCTEKIETRCLTDECLSASASYKLAMDTSINPCDDFYEFSCGQWNADRDNQSVFQRTNNRILFMAEKFLKDKRDDDDFPPVKQSKILFRSCMNPYFQQNPKNDFYVKHLKHLGLSVVPQYISKGKPEVIDVLKLELNMLNSFSASYFFNFNLVYIAINEPYGEVTLRSHLTSVSGFLRDYLQRNRNSSGYRNFIDDLESDDDYDEGSGDDTEGSGINFDDVRGADADDDTSLIGKVEESEMEQIYINLRISRNAKQIRDITERIAALQLKIHLLSAKLSPNKMYTIKSLEEHPEQLLLARNINFLPTWIKYMRMLLSYIKDKYKGILKININVNLLNEFFRMLESTKNNDLELYIWYTALTDIDSSYRVFRRLHVFRSSVKNCTRLVTDMMGKAVSYGLSNLLFNDGVIKKVEKMTLGIHDAYNDAIRSSKWMRHGTKDEVLKKSRNMTRIIGQSEASKDKSALEDYYKNIHFAEDDFFGNVFDLFVFIYNGDLFKFKLGSAKSPIVVNAHYDPQENSINVPLGILNQPMYHLGLDVLNYGALGSIIGHEITHGFAYEEILTDDITLEAVELAMKLKCFRNQYVEAFGNSTLLTYLKGILTNEENVADTCGINLSYTSYKQQKTVDLELPGFEDYTHDQLFFIAYANLWCGNINAELLDSHSLNKYRVTSTLQNSKYFAESFKCRKGTRMNPNRVRCDLFD